MWHPVTTFTVFFPICLSSHSSAFLMYFLFNHLLLFLFIFLLLVLFPLFFSKLLARCYCFNLCSATSEKGGHQDSEGSHALIPTCSLALRYVYPSVLVRISRAQGIPALKFSVCLLSSS